MKNRINFPNKGTNKRLLRFLSSPNEAIKALARKLSINSLLESIFLTPSNTNRNNIRSNSTPTLFQFNGQKYASYKGSPGWNRSSVSKQHIKLANGGSLAILLLITGGILLYPLMDLVRKRSIYH